MDACEPQAALGFPGSVEPRVARVEGGPLPECLGGLALGLAQACSSGKGSASSLCSPVAGPWTMWGG